MTAPARKTVAESVRDRLWLVLERGTYVTAENLIIRSFLAEAEKLAAVDVQDASLVKAEVRQLLGDFEGAKYWIENARKLGATSYATFTETVISVNLGFFTAASALYESLLRVDNPDLKDMFPIGLGTGSFSAMAEIAAKAKTFGIDLGLNGELHMATKCQSVLNRLEVSEAQVQAVLDVAGEVLRKHSLFWQDTAPVIRTLDDEDDAALLYQLKISVDSVAAVQLTDEVIDLLIDRNLHVPGVLFSFLATGQAAEGQH